MKIQAVLFNFIGTVVKDKESTVSRCLSNAFIHHGFYLGHEVLSSESGKDNLTIINDLVDRYSLPRSLVPKIYRSFKKNVEENVENFSASEDAAFVFGYLRRAGIAIGIGTGLSKEIFDFIFSHLRWSKSSFSYIGFSAELGKSRPDPDMIFDMMSKLNIRDPKTILKVGDTVVDLQEGKNAGCLTAVMLSGTQSPKGLMNERPNYVLRSLYDIKAVVHSNREYAVNTTPNRFV